MDVLINVTPIKLILEVYVLMQHHNGHPHTYTHTHTHTPAYRHTSQKGRWHSGHMNWSGWWWKRKRQNTVSVFYSCVDARPKDECARFQKLASKRRIRPVGEMVKSINKSFDFTLKAL